MRDDFSAATKQLLAKRVGYRCSNIHCKRQTIGAGSNGEKTISIGVAAHIKAAAPGGPRFDPYMSSEERRSSGNGIWLCQSCSKLIDSDPEKFTADVLYDWKNQSEELAADALTRSENTMIPNEDTALLRFYVQCMDRPAIQEPMRLLIRKHDPNLVDFERAIRDTVIALNTGVLKTRDGDIIKVAEGKSQLRNRAWYEKLCDVQMLLTEIARELQMCRRDGRDIYCLERMIEENRRKAIAIVNAICDEIGIVGLNHWRI